MKTRTYSTILTLIFAWLLSGCGEGQLIDPTKTPAQPPTATKTVTPIPSNTPTQTVAPTNTVTYTPFPTDTATPVTPTRTPLVPLSVEDVPNVERILVDSLDSQELSIRLNLRALTPLTDVIAGGIVFSEGENGKTVLSCEFPGDVLNMGFGLGIALNAPVELEGQVSFEYDTYNVTIHRFRNRVSIEEGYTFIGEGDDLNLLTFVRIPQVGYIYLRGIGQVIFPNGDVVELGN